ncbi:MAG: tRNA(Ile)(2)-agmatinylcytidine synthase [Candidatus Thermoplasmatota archaeon]|nr:tRNA(Ile)(2)-agmatinylcytidine synthase [Candidatus Thermoplasmatota archaeon]
MWIGIDDTDSRSGMCTTYLMALLAEELSKRKIGIIGYPKLVRLNPSVPWKTRGNAALAIQIGAGAGAKYIIGKIGRKQIFGFEKSAGEPKQGKKEVFEILMPLFEKNAQVQDENTNPGLVVVDEKLPESIYWKAVQDIVEIEDAKRLLSENKAEFEGLKNGRGLVGASAAIAWPAQRKTYEIIAYRQKKNIGAQRKISEKSVIEMDKVHPETFDNYDYENKVIKIAPNTPCPILFGIRAVAPEILPDALSKIKSEPMERWILFETNQGSDDHLVRRKVAEVKSFLSSIVSGVVSEAPHEITGGHVFFKIKDDTGELECAAYEPTKQFRNVIRQLCEGDQVTVYGATRDERLTLNLEKIKIENVAEVLEKVENPTCACGQRMHSMGKAGYRCRACGSKKPKSAAKFVKVERTLKPRWYEVPPVARRHLSRLIRFGIED